MRLSIQKPSRRIATRVVTLIAIFALVAQPMYGLVAERVVNAAGSTTVVRPTNMGAWQQNGRYISFSDAKARVGNGSVRFSTKDEVLTSSGQKHVRTNAFANTKLTDIAELKYSSFIEERTGTDVAPLIRMDVRIFNKNTQLVWEPTYGANPTTGVWQDYDPLTQGRWNVTTATGAGTIFPNKETWVSWDTIKSAIETTDPSASIRSINSGSLSLSAGQNDNTSAPWTNFIGYVDNFKFNGSTYDFEPSEIIPATPQGLKSESNGKDVTNGYTNVDNVKNSWLPATDAVKYNYEFSKPNGLATYAIATTSTSIQGAFHLGDGPDGKYNFRVQSVSATGTTSAWSDWSSVTLDRQSPVVSITPTPTAAGPIHGIVSFEVSVVDNNLDPAQLQNIKLIFSNKRNWDQRSEHTVDLSSGPVTVTTDTSAWSDSEYMWRVPKFTDLAGNNAMGGTNTNGGPYDLYFRWYDVDNTLPTISIDSFQGNKTLRIFREVSFGYYDANKVAYAVFNGTTTHNFEDAVWSNTDTVWANRGWTGVNEGPNTVDLYDLAGNKSSLDFTIDRTAPGNVNIAIDNDVNPSGAIISAKDAHLNRIDVSLWKEGEAGYVAFPGEWINPIGTDFSKDYADKLDLAGLADGKYEIRATAGDAAGNSKNAESRFFTIDRTPPEISILSATKTGANGKTEPGAKVEVRVGESGDWTEAEVNEDGNWSITFSPNLAVGTHQITARATDSAENTNASDTNPEWATETVVVEAEKPATPITSLPNTPQSFPPIARPQIALGNIAITAPSVDPDSTESVAGVTDSSTRTDDGSKKNTRESGDVLAAEDAKNNWSLVNLLLTIFIALASVVSLFGLAGKNKKDGQALKRSLTIIPAIGAVVALLLIEDFSGSMIWVNVWSLLLGVLAVVQMIILGTVRKTTEE